MSRMDTPQISRLRAGLLLAVLLTAACAHAPLNTLLAHFDMESIRQENALRGSDDVMVLLSFSGGGTRAAAFSYGVLEQLRDTEVTIQGQKRRLLDEVNSISSVSGGSFTAGYYGLFGDRIFQDFETRFLKRDVEGALAVRTFLNPVNWVRLFSPDFGRSDLAAEYYDTHVFDGGTFGDMAARKGPLILMNTTDVLSGARIGFAQNAFNVICSDLAPFKVARAAAASSAVPLLLSPITLRNYAGSCGFQMPESLRKLLEDPGPIGQWLRAQDDVRPYLDAEKTRYIHLVDGGVSDNLGLRAYVSRALVLGGFWEAFKPFGAEHAHKVVLILVNAAREESQKYYLLGKVPSFGTVATSYISTTMSQHDADTLLIMRESLGEWAEDVRRHRCGNGPVSTESGACGDIRFYFIEVKFNALKDEAERSYLAGLPTSFSLPSEAVDRLRDAARRILVESDDFQQLLRDLK
jgi:NTE family protein